MALALGRPQAAEESIRAVAGLPDRALLHVMPLCPLEEGRFQRAELEAAGAKGGEGRAIIFSDPEGLREQDHREDFWQRYRRFDSACRNEQPPEALAGDDLAEMTSEPLLLYLLSFSGMDWQWAGANRNEVYRALFAKVHQRDLDKPQGHSSKVGLADEKDFMALMACLGLASWLGGGRVASDDDFETVRDAVYLTKYDDGYRDKKGARLRNVAVQTFTHRGDGEKPGYAFIHKSFGEYLTARALIDAGTRWLSRHEGDPDAFARD